MSHIYDDLPPVGHGVIGFAAVIAEDALDINQRLHVLFPEFNEQRQWGPYRWMPRGDAALPSRGDTAIVVLDNRREGWIIGWWPYDT